MQDITTTAKEVFTVNMSCQLAMLIHKRFGWDNEAAASAWRRLLQNSCSTEEFVEMATMGRRFTVAEADWRAEQAEWNESCERK
jgi:hypothetical protein